MRITHCECVFVSLGIQHAVHMSDICHLWSAPLCYVFPHYLLKGTIFDKKGVTEHKMCVLIFSTTFV